MHYRCLIISVEASNGVILRIFLFPYDKEIMTLFSVCSFLRARFMDRNRIEKLAGRRVFVQTVRVWGLRLRSSLTPTLNLIS